MATVVGEALLSAVAEALVGKISTEIRELYRSKNLDESLLDEKLTPTLLSLQAFLCDAEEKQISNAAVKAWLDKLTQALFDADDLIDDIATEALRRKVEARHHRSAAAKRKRRREKVLCRGGARHNDEEEADDENDEHNAEEEAAMEMMSTTWRKKRR